MGLNNALKKQVDLPVWEWMRFAPSAAGTGSAMTTAGDGSNRYLYFINLAGFYRYDTWADCWQQVQGPPTAAATVAALQYKGYHGYHCRSCGALARAAPPASRRSPARSSLATRSASSAGRARARSGRSPTWPPPTSPTPASSRRPRRWS